MRHRSTDAGFTLFEVLVVVIIASVLAAIAAPSWGAFLNRQKAKRASDHIRQAIQFTQAEARRLRSDRTLVVDTATNELIFPLRDTANAAERVAKAVPLTEGDFGADTFALTVTDVNSAPLDNANEFQLTFSANGGIDVNQNPPDTPVFLTASPNNSNAYRCIIVRSLLGSLNTGSNAQECSVP
ncbi:MAG: Tfp pilus assembly protein FimT/FimU [Elainellaceae cyanobacterium]